MWKETEKTKWKMLEMRGLAKGQQVRAARLLEEKSSLERRRDSKVWRDEVTTNPHPGKRQRKSRTSRMRKGWNSP